jgi:tRNA pseudouridine55 synthase
MNGILVLDKPLRMTSAGAVNRVKRMLPRGVKIGHAGTLDPLATGVLLLLIGSATKSCEGLMNQPKGYEATIKLGATTATDDADSPEIPIPTASKPTLQQIQAALAKFIGTVSQRPPAFSALKVDGQPAYKSARRGKPIDLAPRNVRVDAIEIVAWNWPELKVRIDCGRGTYIRSIARDLGAVLNTGGYLTELRRTRIGQFDISQTVSLETLQERGIPEFLKPVPLPVNPQDTQKRREE